MEGFVIILLAVWVSLLLPGIINRVRAVLAGRRGVTMYQHIHNVWLLLRKGAVYSPSTTLLFRVAPAVCLAAAFTALMMLPLGHLAPLISFNGDVVAFCYLLAAARFALILAAMDTGSSFEGMGASREALYGALVEPGLLVVAGTLALITGNTSLVKMFAGMGGVSAQTIIVMPLLTYAIVRIYIVEAGRVPVDDPRTHLELTMIHEVMVLDYTGVDLGMVTVSVWLRGGAFVILAGNAVAAMFSGSIFVLAATVLLVPALVGVSESFRARNRMGRNSTYILTILAVALLVFFVALMAVKGVEPV